MLSFPVNYTACELQDAEDSIEDKKQKEEIPLVLSAPPDRKARKLLRGTGIDEPLTPCVEGKVRSHVTKFSPSPIFPPQWWI